jgi:hypothetical protein
MEPGDHRAVGGKLGSLAMEKDENGLGHILGKMGISEPAAGNAVNPAQMPPDQVGKCGV